MDLNLLEHAKNYIDKMANGINPLTNENVSESDLINNVKISRCLFYVSGVLDKVINNDLTLFSADLPFNLNEDELKGYVYSDVPLTVSEITKKINALKTNKNMKPLPATKISSWLVEVGVLQIVQENDKNVKRPTAIGDEIGIKIEIRAGKYTNYKVLMYSKKAQEFIIDNFSLFLAYLKKEK